MLIKYKKLALTSKEILDKLEKLALQVSHLIPL